MADHDPLLSSNCIVKSISLKREKAIDFTVYPFSIAAVKCFDRLTLNPRVTFLIGENGSGKSTLLEAIAIALGFNAEGGTKNFNFSTRASHSNLSEVLRVTRGVVSAKDGFFLRAESFYNVATEIEELNKIRPGLLGHYGGKSLHVRSHGESFMALMMNRFGPRGLYLLDEPEAALSPARQLACLRRMHHLVEAQSQFIVATHSPILMAYPGATIYRLDEEGISEVRFEETEHYVLTRRFLEQREAMLKEILSEE